MLVHLFIGGRTKCRMLVSQRAIGDSITAEVKKVTCRYCQRVMAVEVEQMAVEVEQIFEHANVCDTIGQDLGFVCRYCGRSQGFIMEHGFKRCKACGEPGQ